MENTNTFKVQSTSSNLISLNVTPGHYATSSSHINYYIDMTSLKSRRSEAHAAAKVLAARYAATTIIDTIVCLDGTNVIGAYLADELLNTGILSANLHNTAYIISPEQHSGGQLIFRENYLSMIKGKHVLVLAASVTTGYTVQGAVEAIRYYGGEPAGIAAIFATETECAGYPVRSIFDPNDLPDYRSYDAHNCPWCKEGKKIDALVNSFGYSSI